MSTWLAQQLLPQWHSTHPYGDWIRTYASDDFAGLCITLESLLDKYDPMETELAEVYREAMRCELAFFDAPVR